MRKLATGALSFSAAVYLAHYLLPVRLYICFAAALLILALAASAVFRADTRRRALLICIPAALGFLVCLGSFQLRNAPAQELSGFEGEICAVVTDYPRSFPDYGYETVELRLKGEGLPALNTKLYSYNFGLSALRPGDVVELDCKLRSADTRAGRAEDRYNADGVYLFATASSQPLVTEESSSALFTFPKRLARAIESSAQQVFSPEAAPLQTALLTGNKELLYAQEQLYANMGKAGILHIVAVSGMHVAFLVGFIQSLVRKKRAAALISLAIVWLFVPVAGAVPSVVRAAFMQSTVLLAPLLGRENDSITSLSAVLALLLFINPDACAGVGLQLSFTAMLGILTLTPRIYGSLSHALPKKTLVLPKKLDIALLRAIYATFAATIGALAFSAPLSALYFDYVSLTGIIVNVLIFALVSACFSLGYVACILGLLWLPAGRLVGALVSKLAELEISLVNAGAKLPYTGVYTGSSIYGWWLVIVYIIFITCYVFRRRKGFRPVLPTCLAVCSLCAVIILTGVSVKNQPPQLTALNVGQGQCLIFACGEETIVIDCGGKSGERNAGELAASELLGSGRRSVELLALTHLDDDHINGVSRLMSRVRVKALLLPAEGEDDEKDNARRELLEIAADTGAEVYIIEDDSQCELGDMTLEAYCSRDIKQPSLSFLWSAGESDVLITGDADMTEERYLIQTHTLPPVEVYIVGHHGSKNSSSPELLSALGAKTAVVSSGYNSYGHPTPQALARIEAAGMEILRTDSLGSIRLVMEGA